MRIRFYSVLISVLLLLSAESYTYSQVPTPDTTGGKGMEISFQTLRPGNIFLSGDTAQFKITVTHIPDSVKGLYLHWQVVDIEHKAVSENEEYLTRWENGGFIYPLSVNPNVNGWYQLQVTLRDTTQTLITRKENLAWVSKIPDGGLDSNFGIDLNLADLSSAETENSGRLTELAGIRWIRQGFTWNKIQPHPDQWDWKDMDNAVLSAKRFHLNILGELNGNTDWSQSSTENRDQLFAKFVSQVVSRYKDKITNWEIQNEMTTAWRAAKDADSQCKIIVPARWGDDTSLISKNIGAKGSDSPDGVALHLTADKYADPKQFVEELTQTSQLLSKTGGKKELWLTGMGRTGGSLDNSGENANTAQASSLVRNYILACCSSLADKLLWDSFRNSLPRNIGENSNGLLEPDFSPKPSYVALSNMTRQLNGYNFITTLNLGNDCAVYLFQKENQKMLAAWHKSGSVTIGIESDANSLNVTDLYGNTVTLLPIDKTVSVTLTDKPIYISGNFTQLKALTRIIDLKIPVSQAQQGGDKDLGVQLRDILSPDVIDNVAGKISDSINQKIIGEEKTESYTIKPEEEKELQYKLNISNSETVGITPPEVQMSSGNGGTFKLQTELRIFKKKPVAAEDTTQNASLSKDTEK